MSKNFATFCESVLSPRFSVPFRRVSRAESRLKTGLKTFKILYYFLLPAYLFKLLLVFSSLIVIFGCSRIEEKPKVATKTEQTNIQPEKSQTHKSKTDVDVIQYANKPASVLDEAFGKPVKITEIKDNPRLMPGEFREYRVAGHPKNLSVRFYKEKAKRFNLLLGKPEKSSKDALKDIFKIDVSEMKRIKSDTLSETWAGKINGINFKTAYAKRSKAGGDFVMLHAEIE
ncbi:MAG: hypothetical protein ACR2J3_04295 [Aridibacter sp.]